MSQASPEELSDSIILQQFAGLKNTLGTERLGPGDLERATNVDIDDAGQVRRRRGYTLKASGNYHSLKDIGGKIYAVKDGSLGIVRANYSFTSLQAVGASALSYTAVDGDVYFSGEGGSGIVTPAETVISWGAADGQGQWISPVIQPTETLGAISGKLTGPPPRATAIEAYSGRIYLAVGKTLWATELYLYHHVDKTKNFMQFEHDIVLLMAVADGIFVGTTGGLYFIRGILGKFQLSLVVSDPVLPGSGTWVPADLVHPSARNGPMPTGEAVVLMTTGGILACFDGGSAFNLTHDRVVFPQGVSAAALYRQDSGVSSYVAAVDSAGGPSANARIGDYVDAEIIRASQGG